MGPDAPLHHIAEATRQELSRMTSQDDLAQARAAQAENLGKFVRDFQAKQLKDAAIVAAPGLAMAAWSAHQQS